MTQSKRSTAQSPARFVSRLTSSTLALVLAGGRGSRLGQLTDWRTKPAVPFGGKFRIIDFTLSNCLNSSIRRICVLTQYKSHSLIQHVLQGWNRFDHERGEFIDLIPAQQWVEEESWYQGTADAVFQSLDIIGSYRPEYVLILSGDHIYNMDYGEMLATHVRTRADFTIACIEVDKESAKKFGVMEVDDKDRIISFAEKPDDPAELSDKPGQSLVSMGIYVVSLKFLRAQLLRDASDEASSRDFGKDVIPQILKAGKKAQAHRFTNPDDDHAAYWRDVGTIDAYYQANMELLSAKPPLDLYDPHWQTITYQAQLPPACILSHGESVEINDTILSGGCLVQQAQLKKSILFSNVRVNAGSNLEGVLALPGCEIGQNVRLKNVILDNMSHVPDGAEIGFDPELDKKRFHVTEDGVIVVNREMLGQGHHYKPGIKSDLEG